MKTINLPCNFGERIYYPCAWGIESGTVSHFTITKDNIWIYDEHDIILCEAEDVCKTQYEADELRNKYISIGRFTV